MLLTYKKLNNTYAYVIQRLDMPGSIVDSRLLKTGRLPVSSYVPRCSAIEPLGVNTIGRL